jgi:hypothetical protein
MRITVKLDCSADPGAFAILWLDLDVRHWSREMHSGVDIPSWGLVRTTHGGAAVICDPDSTDALCTLTGLDLENRTPLIEGLYGDVAWYGDPNLEVRLDRWHVQCIESDSIEAENAVFDE